MLRQRGDREVWQIRKGIRSSETIDNSEGGALLQAIDMLLPHKVICGKTAKLIFPFSVRVRKGSVCSRSPELEKHELFR